MNKKLVLVAMIAGIGLSFMPQAQAQVSSSTEAINESILGWGCLTVPAMATFVAAAKLGVNPIIPTAIALFVGGSLADYQWEKRGFNKYDTKIFIEIPEAVLKEGFCHIGTGAVKAITHASDAAYHVGTGVIEAAKHGVCALSYLGAIACVVASFGICGKALGNQIANGIQAFTSV